MDVGCSLFNSRDYYGSCHAALIARNPLVRHRYGRTAMDDEQALRGAAKKSAGLAAGALISSMWNAYCRYCWMRVVRRPASPCWSIEYCHDRNSSTVSV